jgi:hypothetical protein
MLVYFHYLKTGTLEIPFSDITKVEMIPQPNPAKAPHRQSHDHRI